MKNKGVWIFLLLVFILPVISSENTELTIMSSATFSFSEHVSPYEKAESYQELQQMITDYKNNLDEEVKNTDRNLKQIYENQNKIKTAIYSFLSMEKLIPSVGIIVSDIATQLNNSFISTAGIENKIISRSSFSRFFVGGNFNLADNLESEINSTRDRLSLLEELALRCSDSQEIKNFFNEQIQIIKEEQNRLQELVNSEKSSKGIIGWIWK